MSAVSNIRLAARMLRMNPGFAAVAIITLALGIGATTAMFTVLDGVVLKSLRYPDASRIVSVDTKFTDKGRTIWSLTGGDLEDIRADKNTFEAFSWCVGGEQGIQLPKTAEYVGAYMVNTEFSNVFAVPPIAGRPFTGDDAGRAAMVGAGFAERNFGSASAALGQTIRLEGVAYDIVGVMPAFFDFPKQAQVWVAVSPIPDNRNRNSYNYRAVAKLQQGVSPAVANARLDSLATRLAAAFPRDNRNKTFLVASLQDQLSAPVRSTLFILMGAVGLVLLIACANVANLMLARATSRSRELAVRAAMGATRAKLILQLLSESVALAVVACAVGILLAAWGTKVLLAVGAQFVPAPMLGGITLDWRVLVFAVAAAFLTSIVFGIAPSWQATRVNLQDALKQGGTRGALGAGNSALRSSLVVAQIALSLTLAVGAGLLFRTMLSLENTDLGFHTEGLLVAYAHDPAHTLPEAIQAGQFFDDLYPRLKQISGVISAAGAMGLPTGQFGSNGSYSVEGKYPPMWDESRNAPASVDFRKLPYADFSLASPGYFSTLGMKLLRGRDFNGSDQYDRPPVVIISESAARQVFPNEDPLGHRIQCGLDSPKWMTIVGVVSDVRQDSPADPPGPTLYMPLRQHPFRGNEIEVVMRTSGNPDALVPAVQNMIRQTNPEVATKFTTMTELVSDSITAQRFRTVLASSFAILALLLALSGMYAVMSYVTARRTSEFGLRSALGAQPGSIVGLVLGGAARLAIIGIIAGLVLSFISTRLLSTMLFGVQAADPRTYIVVIAIVLPVIVLAAALPAWRASQVDPLVALRNE